MFLNVLDLAFTTANILQYCNWIVKNSQLCVNYRVDTDFSRVIQTSLPIQDPICIASSCSPNFLHMGSVFQDFDTLECFYLLYCRMFLNLGLSDISS